MKFLRLLMPLAALLLLVSSATAQSRQLDALADRLVEQASQMAEQSYMDFTDRSRNTRADVEALYQDEQVKSSAELFSRMVRDRRPRTQLQNASAVLSDLARSADRYNRQRPLMTDIRRTIADIQRDLNFGGGIGPGTGGGISSGTMRWRGTIDDVSQLRIRDNSVEVIAIGGQEYSDGAYNFTSPMPSRGRGVAVRLNKIRGRGDVRIIQQPSRANDYTTIVEVRDMDRGPSDYEFEISW
ncbi:MAG: hypothetical protein H7Y30_00325 [Pyrinomonadaceae bacterium]|nr:hypothetical protein [Pyrinomonadaceae bacterium]